MKKTIMLISLVGLMMIMSSMVFAADSDFYLADNNVTVKCPEANVGDSGEVNGINYTKRNDSLNYPINTTNANTTCTSGITDMGYIFQYASSFNQSLRSWDTSNVTFMGDMFRNAGSFNGDISNWNTSKVTDMHYMFENASSFNQSLNNWDTSSVKDMRRMFTYAESFNGDISNWNTSKVTDMGYMFKNATSFNQSLKSWDTSSVTDMSGMFEYASSFNSNISGWDTRNVMDMGNMFKNASSFNQDLGNWNVSSLVHSPGPPVGSESAYQMFDFSGLSYENYDNILIGWANQSPDLNEGVHLGASGVGYCKGSNARDELINESTHNWSINDGGYYICDPATNPTVQNLSSDLNITNENGTQDYETDAQSGVKIGIMKDATTGLQIANISINFSKEVDFGDVKAGVDSSQAKSFLHIPSGHDEIVDKKLKVPVIEGTGEVYVCPNATSLDQVTSDCDDSYIKSGLESKGGYYQIDISSTGALETSSDDTTTIPEFNLVGMILIIAIAGIALYFITNRRR